MALTDWQQGGGIRFWAKVIRRQIESGSREIPAEVTLLFWGLKSPRNPTPLAILPQTGPTKAVKEIRTSNLSEVQAWARQTSPTDPTHRTNAEEENTEMRASLLCNPVTSRGTMTMICDILYQFSKPGAKRERAPENVLDVAPGLITLSLLVTTSLLFQIPLHKYCTATRINATQAFKRAINIQG